MTDIPLSGPPLWALILVLAAVTYLLRVSFVALFSYIDVPEPVERHLHLVAPAVMAAVAVPPLFYREGTYHLSLTDPFLVAGLAGAVVAWRTKRLLLTMVVGLATYGIVAVAPIP
jgi:branched-subunit amino acid transport protein